MEGACLGNTEHCSGFMSFFFREFLKKPPPWESCCDIHDIPYEDGGPLYLRKIADQKLRECVRKSGHPVWAEIMYYAVRVGGHPYIPSPTVREIEVNGKKRWKWSWTGARWGFKKYKWPQYKED